MDNPEKAIDPSTTVVSDITSAAGSDPGSSRSSTDPGPPRSSTDQEPSRSIVDPAKKKKCEIKADIRSKY